MTIFLHTQRFSHNDHSLPIHIEYKKRQTYSQQYAPDTDTSTISSRVKLQGYEIYENHLLQKFHSYKKNREDGLFYNEDMETFFRLISGIRIKRPDRGNFLKAYLHPLMSAYCLFIKTTTTNLMIP